MDYYRDTVKITKDNMIAFLKANTAYKLKPEIKNNRSKVRIVVGKKEGAFAASSESTSFPNLEFKMVRDIGPGEIVKMKADGLEVLQPPSPNEQICSFLWV